ncbi:hypothetical protein B0T25DRAFT_458228 [Lasiosphaeria hispida]|uniref:Dynamin N-terminal domain-containing protein n=1 Tax=Lasiosphaeria hispida TaxID=260671 RepID=A0AAJ0HFD8_9PEZI|nr:hypothetical protein B0T25DRAFT_458228 [Lasiosphaeria hispida]
MASNPRSKTVETHWVWQTLQDLSPVARLQVLEEALDNASKHSAEFARLIGGAIGGDDGLGLTGTKHLRQWVQEIETLASKQKAFELLIGVQGPTGAGKSTLLNAVLGYKNLLPSSNAEASTATICKVGYNYVDDPQRAFRADIVFRSQNDVKQEVGRFFADLQDRQRLLEDHRNHDGEDDRSDTLRQNELEEVNANINAAASKIQAVWGFSVKQLEKMNSSAELFAKSDPTAKFLSTTKSIHGANAEAFARDIKPFLDSTYSEMAGSSGAATRNMAVWPLIDHVDIWIKSDLLKGGLVLVDLPGLSDAVEGRAAVARRYYQELAVAVIVTPSVRAADERTGVGLMDENQELTMRMNGKFNNRSFCVVLSKVDDIDWETAAKNEGRSEHIQRIAEQRKLDKRAKTTRKDIKKELKSLRKKLSAARDETIKNEARDEMKKLKERQKRIRKHFKSSPGKVSNLTGEAIYAAIKTRNQVLNTRILGHLKDRHDEFVDACPDSGSQFVVPNIFPVSTKAFWSLDESAQKRVNGFPSVAYTGIPALVQWLREATAPQRETQVLSLLNRYVGLYNNVQTWMDDKCKTTQKSFSAAQLKSELLDPQCDNLRKALERNSRTLEIKIKECDPLKSKTKAMSFCTQHSNNLVARWVYKHPDDETSILKLHALTFAAIVRRGGDDFMSFAGGKKMKYNWMGVMANAFKRRIAGQWIQELHQNIPNTAKQSRAAIENTWESYMKSLMKVLIKYFPEQKDYLQKQRGRLDDIKNEVTDLVVKAINDISNSSPDIHANLQSELKAKWALGFKKAMNVAGGKGVTQRRHDKLKAFAKTHGKRMYEEAVRGMEEQFQAHLRSFPSAVGRAWDHGLEKFRVQMELIIGNIVRASNHAAVAGAIGTPAPALDDVSTEQQHQAVVLFETADARRLRIELEESVRLLLTNWGTAWDIPSIDIGMGEDIAIPSVYVWEGDSWSASSDGGSDSDEDSDDDEMVEIKEEPE